MIFLGDDGDSQQSLTLLITAYNTIYIMTESLLLWSCRRLGLHPLFPKLFEKIHLSVGKGKFLLRGTPSVNFKLYSLYVNYFFKCKYGKNQ